MNIRINHEIIELTANVKLNELRQQNIKAEWWNTIVDFLEEWASEKTTIKVKSSGSTGTAKTWEVEKQKFWVSAKKTCDFFSLNSSSSALLCLSANYIAGKMMLVRAMVSGMNLICIEPQGNPVKDLEQEIDFCAMVPLQVKEALQNVKQLNLIKNLLIGGGQVDFQLQKSLAAYQGHAFESFGMTETLSHIALRQISPENELFFKVLNGITISQGNNNTLIIDYPELGINKLQTNDIIELTNVSGEFRWKGRSDFVINSGGVKVLPEEVEKQIAHLIKQRFCISGKADDKLGEKVVLLIEGKANATTTLFDELKKSLAPYSCPKEIIFIDKFPLTDNGKIRRKELTEIFS